MCIFVAQVPAVSYPGSVSLRKGIAKARVGCAMNINRFRVSPLPPPSSFSFFICGVFLCAFFMYTFQTVSAIRLIQSFPKKKKPPVLPKKFYFLSKKILQHEPRVKRIDPIVKINPDNGKNHEQNQNVRSRAQTSRNSVADNGRPSEFTGRHLPLFRVTGGELDDPTQVPTSP